MTFMLHLLLIGCQAFVSGLRNAEFSRDYRFSLDEYSYSSQDLEWFQQQFIWSSFY
jgi:hypothetical protein